MAGRLLEPSPEVDTAPPRAKLSDAGSGQYANSAERYQDYRQLVGNSLHRQKEVMQKPPWLEWARRLEALAQNGLAYCKDPYDRERYEEIQHLALEMTARGAGLPNPVFLVDLFKNEVGYATPKIDVRTAVFDRDRVLLVRERQNGLRTLPGGGWANVGGLSQLGGYS